MWPKTNEKFDQLIGKLTEALVNRQSDPLLVQHLGECVRRQDKIEATLEIQRTAALAMHNENRLNREKDNQAANARFVKILLLLIAGLLSPFAVQAFEFLKTHSR